MSEKPKGEKKGLFGHKKHEEVSEAPKEAYQPKESKPSSVGADASSESKHHHKKFDKFKKGNS